MQLVVLTMITANELKKNSVCQIAQSSVDLCFMIREYGSCGEDEWLICQCNNSSGVILLDSESTKYYISSFDRVGELSREQHHMHIILGRGICSNLQ